MVRMVFVLLMILIISSSLVGVSRVVAQGSVGTDLDYYCRSQGYKSVVLTTNTVYGFRCEDWQGNRVSINMYQVCTMQAGTGWRPVFSDYNNPYSWSCWPPLQSSTPVTPTAQPNSCNGLLGPVVKVGDRAMISFVPDDPNVIHSDREATRRVGLIYPGDTFTIVAGPFCAKGLLRWQIQLNDGRIVYTANGDATHLWVVPATTTVTPQPQNCYNNLYPTVSVGQRGMISYDPPFSNRLYAEAEAKTRIGSLKPGTQFTVIGGPVCSQGRWYQQVRLDDGTVGWTASGDNIKPWVVPSS